MSPLSDSSFTHPICREPAFLTPLISYRGGPLWKPMCYTQIGRLLLATIITRFLFPVLQAIFVLDLKNLK